MCCLTDAVPQIPVARSGSYPLRAGNLVRPLVDGAPAFRRIGAAVDAARHSVWLTVPFLMPEFRMPDGGGSLFDVLDHAVVRGLDVRVLFWRPDPGTPEVEGRTFPGGPGDRDRLSARGSRFRARWDRAPAGHCHHQKSWIIDAGRPTETAFVGGINLNPHSIVDPGHVGEGHNHDIYAELAGPAATDVHHNFVQRWNEASERGAPDGTWGHQGDDDLAFPAVLSEKRGDSPVQIQRTVHAGRYRDGRASPGGRVFDIAGGEQSILEQYRLAIGAARRSIYIENQAIGVADIVSDLDDALARGVVVVVLVPSEPEAAVRKARRLPEYRPLFDRLAALGRHRHFALAGIAGPGADGCRHDVYVHAKIMLIDDAWATIGSCNLHKHSLTGHSELNLSVWDLQVVRALRCTLLAEHLALDTAGLDDAAALRLYGRVARGNRRRRDAGSVDWQGLAFSLDPDTYGA